MEMYTERVNICRQNCSSKSATLSLSFFAPFALAALSLSLHSRRQIESFTDMQKRARGNRNVTCLSVLESYSYIIHSEIKRSDLYSDD